MAAGKKKNGESDKLGDGSLCYGDKNTGKRLFYVLKGSLKIDLTHPKKKREEKKTLTEISLQMQETARNPRTLESNHTDQFL